MPCNDSPPSVPKLERWGMEVVVEREAMFEKALTPSDVGKLNRLVIPKQHAERYFPVENREKGMELSFEDEAGKMWGFRYSYWSSSQSYVLTKGWSRFVKENMLHAGDVVSFDRFHGDRLYISCRRRATFCPASARAPAPSSHATCNIRGGHYAAGNSLVPATCKRLRLFGVNLDFPADEPSGSCWSSQGQTDATFFQRVQSSGSSSQS